MCISRSVLPVTSPEHVRFAARAPSKHAVLSHLGLSAGLSGQDGSREPSGWMQGLKLAEPWHVSRSAHDLVGSRDRVGRSRPWPVAQ